MRNFIISICFLLLSIPVFLSAQVTTDPGVPTADQAVTIYLDASMTGLAGYDGDVYAHTGLTINGTRWSNVIGDWGENSVQPLVTRTGTDQYQLDITPTIRNFYNAAAGDDITEICIVFRSADGPDYQQTSPDIFIGIFELGLNVILTSPDISPYFVDPGQTINITAESTLSDMFYLYVDDALITSTSGNSINENITASSDPDSKHWIKVVAEDDQNMVADSIYFYVRGQGIVEDLPAGVVDGINYIDAETVTLVLHAPYKSSVYAIGDFNDWQVGTEYRLKRNMVDNNDFETRYWLTIQNLNPGEEYAFQYLIDEELRVADAYTDKILDKWNDHYIPESTYPNLKPYPENKTDHIVSVLQTNQDEYSWQVANFDAPEPTDLVVYEMLLRDFIAAQNFKVLKDTLSYFKKLGVNAIEVMPFSEFEGNLSWGYNPSFYFAPDKYYGTKDDVKAFVDACHAEGIAVITDMVLNHAYGQNVFARMYWDEANSRPAANNPWFNAECPHEPYCWGNDFNYQSSATKDFADRVSQYWLDEYNLDGIRFDYTAGFTNSSTGGSYNAARIETIKRIADAMWEVNPDAYVILEHWCDNSEEKVLAEYGCMPWSNMGYSYNEGTMGYNEDGKSDFSWMSYQERGWSVPHAMCFMESHDEERMMHKNVSWGNSSGNYDITDTTTALERQALAAAFFYTIPGPKMIWQFQERGFDYSINWPSGEENDRLTAKPPRWDYMDDLNRKYLYHVNAALIGLKTSYDVFKTTDYSIDLHNATKSITLRGADMKVVVVGNFDVVSQDHAPDWPNVGIWYEFFTQTQLDVTSTTQLVNLQHAEYRLYSTQHIEKPEWLNNTSVDELFAGNKSMIGAYPNPTNGEMNFIIFMDNPGNVVVEVFDAMGKNVANIEGNNLNAGTNELNWNAAVDLNPGIYFAIVSSDKYRESIKFVVE